MQVRCPHCHDRLEIAPDDPLTDIECASCGSRFQLVPGDSTRSFRPKTANSFGRFELIDCVGTGAFGTVWKARDTELQRVVALKIPHRGRFGEEASEPILREARTAAQLRHPHIVSIHEVGREQDTLYIVSEFIEGVNLREWLSGQRLTPREGAELCAMVADALHHAHELGVVHRDLKPSNIMLDASGKPYLTDFGLAKRNADDITMTLDGELLGTPSYMSPEQAGGKGKTADRRSDVYSLGVILYELLTGELPFCGEQPMLIWQIQHIEPRSPRILDHRVPVDLETICLKCLEKDPARRYPTAKDVADDLRRFLDGKPIAARPVTRRERFWRWCKRYPTIAALSAAVLVTLLTGSVVSTYFALRASRNAQNADIQAQAVTRALYDSYIEQVNIRRAERAQGYRETVHQLIDRARRLDTPRVNPDQLRQEMVSVMGDFVGSTPTLIEGFPSDAAALALSSDGSQVAIGFGNGSIWICDAATAKRQFQLALRQAKVLLLRFASNGHRLVAADVTGFVQQWNYSDGKWTSGKSFSVGTSDTDYGASQHEDSLVAFHKEGVEIWEIAEGRLKHSFSTPDGTPRSAALDASQTRLAVAYKKGSSDVMALAVWNLEGGEKVFTKDFDLGFTYSNGMAFSGDSRRLVIGFDQGLIEYDTSDFRQVTLKRSDAVKAATFSPNNQYLVAVENRGQITMWNAATDREVARLFNWRKAVSRECLTFSRDGSALAECNGTSARVWSLISAREKLVLLGHAGGIPCVAFRGDGELLATGSKDQRVRLWDANSGQLLADIPAPGAVQTISFSPDQRFLAVGYWEGKDRGIQIFDVATRNPLVTERHELGEVDSLDLFDRDGEHFLAASGTSGLSLWRVQRNASSPASMKLSPVVHHDGQFCVNLAVSAGARWIAWVDNPGPIGIRVWDFVQPKPHDLHAPRMNQGWHGLAFDQASDNLAFISEQGMAEFWDVARDASSFRLGDEGHFKAPHIALSRDGKWLAGLVEPDVVEIWNTSERKRAYTFRPERSSVWSLAWSPDSQRLAVGFSDGGLAIWSLSAIRDELQQMGL